MQMNRVFIGDTAKVEEYNKLCDKMRDCRRCDGLNQRGSNIYTSTLVVFGSGNLNSKIMFVGQSACTACQRTGIPFTEHSGDILDLCLKDNGLTRKDVFISNVCHCHPPNNRPSKPEEIKNCKEYLTKELALVNPQLVIALGGDALKWFMPNASLINTVGKPLPTLTYLFTSLYHPAYVYRSKNLLPYYREMFKKAIQNVP